MTNPRIPNEINGITKVFGKTCNYSTVANVDYGKAAVGDVVGYLDCLDWKAAKCKKDDLCFACIGLMLYRDVACW